MSASALRSAGPESACPNCLTPGARPGERCSGCRLRLELDTCAVEAWQGHGTCAFVARRADGTLVAVSPAFRADDCTEPAEGPETEAARDELVASLAEQGWRHAKGRRKGPWFSTRLERLVALDGPEFDVPPTEAAAAPVVVTAGAQAAPRRRRGSLLVTVVSLAGLVVAGILAYAVLARGSQHHTTRIVTLPPPASTPAKTIASTPKPKPAAAPARVKKVELAITATRASWLELRRGSRTGKILYSGELPAGRSLHERAPRIWARFGAAANLEIVVDGSRVPLQGTLERVFTAT